MNGEIGVEAETLGDIANRLFDPFRVAIHVKTGDLSSSGGIWAWRADGQRINLCPEMGSDYPIWREGGRYHGRVSIADLDHNGRVDLIATSMGNFAFSGAGADKHRDSIYVWELDVPYRPATMLWPTWQHDAQRTGRYTPPPPNALQSDWPLYE